MVLKEVIIVGGGPAGASCSRQLQRNKVDCLVLDKCSFPRDKLCAGWITPAVFKMLDIDVDTYPHSLITFRSLKIEIYGKKITIPTKQYSIRRSEFDHWLLQRSNAPIKLHQVKKIEKKKSGFIIDDMFKCKYLVGAGGTNCPVARLLFDQINHKTTLHSLSL